MRFLLVALLCVGFLGLSGCCGSDPYLGIRNPFVAGSTPAIQPVQYGQMVSTPAPLYTAPAQIPAQYQPCR